MKHRTWISAQQLDMWARTNAARELFPQFVRELIYATTDKGDLLHIDFPAGEEIGRHGYDGVTRTRAGNDKVPAGIAYWELGAGEGPKKKFNGDYKKRIEKRGDGDFSGVTYIAATPRKFGQKREWAKDKTQLGEWGGVEAYDSSDFEQWLQGAPAVARKWSRSISHAPDGLTDIATYSDNLQSCLRRVLPGSLLLAGRERTVERFDAWSRAEPGVLAISAHSPQELIDALVAWVISLPPADQDKISTRALIVDDPERWRELASNKDRLFLVAGQRLELAPELAAEAVRNGHHVVTATSLVGISAGRGERMDRIDRRQIHAALCEAGISEQEASRLAHQSGGSFTVLKRQFSANLTVEIPPWGKDDARGELAPLFLLGAWHDKCDGDRAIVVEVSAHSYPTCHALVNKWRTEPDAPVRWSAVSECWEFVSPLDAWTFLSPGLSADILDAFEAAAIRVLTADDPRLELPMDERWRAEIHGRSATYSDEMREGIARTLALLATREEADQIADAIPLRTRAARVVRRILPEGCGWARWASLGDLLPLIAEAAPDVFLEAVEAGLRGDDPELLKLFEQSSGGVTGCAEHAGLLWGLERVAWSDEHLPRASLALGKLADRVPACGGWGNTPAASLRGIFFSPMPQTAAPLKQRLDAICTLAARCPNAGWKLLLSLLPSGQEMVTENRRPEWRFWAEHWKPEISASEYQDTVAHLVHFTIEIAKHAGEKWPELVECIPDLAPAEFRAVVTALEQAAAVDLEGNVRQAIWKLLGEQVNQHQYFGGAGSALPRDEIERLAELRGRFEPSDPVLMAVPLFEYGPDFLGNRNQSWEEAQAAQRARRVDAIWAALGASGLAGIKRLAGLSDDKYAVGDAAAEVTGGSIDSEVLPPLLCCGDDSLEKFALGYLLGRIRLAGVAWAESLPLSDWSPAEAGRLLAQLPFGERIWAQAASLGKETERSYWENVRQFSVDLSGEQIERAARTFCSVGRPAAAVDLFAQGAYRGRTLPPPKLLELLELALAAPRRAGERPIDFEHLAVLLQRLQAATDVDGGRVAAIEWAFLRALSGRGMRPLVLERILAQHPSEFIEVLKMAFRPHHREKANDSEPNETERTNATRAWQLLREWKRVPGTSEDGNVNSPQLTEWIATTRLLAADADRIEVCDTVIGEVFAHSPSEPDGSWPCIPVREAIESADSAELSRGFSIGIFNKRGVYSKALGQGGTQERELADKFDGYANQCRTRWPLTAAALSRVAVSYREQALREDAQANSHE